MKKVSDWSKFPNFAKAEFDCKETGENEIKEMFLRMLQALRTAYGKPMRITSGYRSPKHSIEVKKAQPGTHAQGIACDIACTGSEAYELIALAVQIGFTGIGVSQKSNGARFVHLDIAERQAVWSY